MLGKEKIMATLGKNYKLFKLISGEMLITEVTEVMDDGMLVISLPSVILPIPPEQAEGKQNQLGFGKLMPFSNYSEDILLNPKSISVDSKPDKRMLDAYESWCTQVRSEESRIIVPNMKSPNIPKSGSRGNTIDFSKLNTRGGR